MRKHDLGRECKKDKMGGERGMHGRKEKAIQDLVGQN
jgi:hypothetical protein